MPFHIEVNELVLDYLSRSERELSVEDIEKLLDFLDGSGDIANFSDEVRNDPFCRCGHDSPVFWAELVFLDEGGKPRVFRFGVDDSGAPAGVLRVGYVEEVKG